MTDRSFRTISWRRIVGEIHLWAGLLLCLPLILLGVTGTILVGADHLGGPVKDPARQTAGAAVHSVGEIIEAARAAAPDGFIASLYAAPPEPGEPASIRLQSAAGRGTPPIRMEIDGATLTPVTRPEGTALRWLHMLHANLLMGEDGRHIVGWFGLVMLTLGISGLINWWPRRNRWRAALTMRRGLRGAAFHRALHGVVGIWTLIVFLAVGFSGVALAFPQTMRDLVDVFSPARDLRALAGAIRVQPIPGSRPITVDEAITLAMTAIPDGRLASVALPLRPDQPFRIGLLPSGGLQGSPQIGVFIDPWRRDVVTVLDPRDFSAGESLLAWQHALHSARGLGGAWTTLVFLSGGLPLLFSVTGVALWWIKRAKKTAR
ncbi:PepSY-associated TM helix domain-containing protein [Telmatospirillum siberiense]|uniref:PepSY domain-containing protein n=1 Tax=Telmatospirillum siberiense TaxID=382514 RepID=A0A2N3PYY8_9PROT|nr:PepSY-associated TM helix domain-containing protein [Telmatospirillum siberiense]PKU25626.1 PepSY domain-containing protein [Telmatospirillum siberiense]